MKKETEFWQSARSHVMYQWQREDLNLSVTSNPVLTRLLVCKTKLQGEGGGGSGALCISDMRCGAGRADSSFWAALIRTQGVLGPRDPPAPAAGERRGIKFILSQLQNRTMRNDGLSFQRENSSVTHKISINKSHTEQTNTSLYRQDFCFRL